MQSQIRKLIAIIQIRKRRIIHSAKKRKLSLNFQEQSSVNFSRFFLTKNSPQPSLKMIGFQTTTL